VLYSITGTESHKSEIVARMSPSFLLLAFVRNITLLHATGDGVLALLLDYARIIGFKVGRRAIGAGKGEIR
jgi:hypothetical protein